MSNNEDIMKEDNLSTNDKIEDKIEDNVEDNDKVDEEIDDKPIQKPKKSRTPAQVEALKKAQARNRVVRAQRIEKRKEEQKQIILQELEKVA